MKNPTAQDDADLLKTIEYAQNFVSWVSLTRNMKHDANSLESRIHYWMVGTQTTIPYYLFFMRNFSFITCLTHIPYSFMFNIMSWYVHQFLGIPQQIPVLFLCLPLEGPWSGFVDSSQWWGTGFLSFQPSNWPLIRAWSSAWISV